MKRNTGCTEDSVSRIRGKQRAVRRALTVAVALLTALFVGVLGTWIFLDWGTQRLSIVTPSMSPLINPGDIAIIKPVSLDHIEVGDILTVKVGMSGSGAFLTHRVIGFQTVDGEKMLLMKGDVNNTPDPPGSADRVVGRVVRFERQSILTEIFSRFYEKSFA